MLKFNTLLATLLISSLISCSSNRTQLSGSTASLNDLKAMGMSTQGRLRNQNKMSRIREQALQEIALSLGAQSALAVRAKKINNDLSKQEEMLGKIYSFRSLLLRNNVLPPILQEGRTTLNLASSNTLRVSDRTYKILEQARFVTTTPTWRQYLWLDYRQPERPNITLLPKNTNERHIWNKYVTIGWKRGIDQADTILTDRLAKLKEDFLGMVIYRKLLAQNMVSPPFVSHTELGVTGDNNEMHIDDKVLRITALPQLNVSSDTWRPAVSKDKEQLKRFEEIEKLASRNTVVINDKNWHPVIPTLDD